MVELDGMVDNKNKTMKKIILSMTVLTMFSCSTSQLTQKQVKINYELDKLWIDYKYESDSLINEFYKK
mgnify:FL=1